MPPKVLRLPKQGSTPRNFACPKSSLIAPPHQTPPVRRPSPVIGDSLSAPIPGRCPPPKPAFFPPTATHPTSCHPGPTTPDMLSCSYSNIDATIEGNCPCYHRRVFENTTSRASAGTATGTPASSLRIKNGHSPRNYQCWTTFSCLGTATRTFDVLSVSESFARVGQASNIDEFEGTGFPTHNHELGSQRIKIHHMMQLPSAQLSFVCRF
ncbi:hypothetical protein EV424DRAFT_229555 [Suillus variegatus]|nr:hypothetical protein EV424DRAFT_229555 [Suillus variegatus]